MLAHPEGGVHEDSPAVAEAVRCRQEERRGEAEDEVLIIVSLRWLVVDDPLVAAVPVSGDPLVHTEHLRCGRA